GKTTSNVVISKLPSGLDALDFEVTLITYIYDILGAAATEENRVIVKADSSVDLSSYVSDSIAAALAAGDTRGISQIISAAGSTLSAANCSAVDLQYCDNLNRGSCVATPQTCSQCKEGFTGLVGDWNTPCVNASTALLQGRIGASCTKDIQCRLSNCSSNICAAPVLPCFSDTLQVCSGRGTCQYSDCGGSPYSTLCTALDTGCQAACLCDIGANGASCGFSDAVLDTRDDLRGQLCEAILTVASLSDVSEELMDQLTSSLLVVYDPTEVVTAESQDFCEQALALLSSYATSGLLTNPTTILQLAQLNSKFVTSATTSSASRRLSASSEAAGAAVNAAVGELISGILQNMAYGEDSVTYADDKIQMILYKGKVSGLASIAPPATEAAAAYGVAAVCSLEFTPTATAFLEQAGSGYVELAVLYWGSNPFANASAMGSSLLRMEALFKESDSDTCQRRLLEGAQKAQGAEGVEGAEGAEGAEGTGLDAAPSYDFFVTMQFTTQQDLNFSITPSQAQAEGATNFTIPQCVIFDGEAYQNCSGCAISSYSNTNVTYGCPLFTLEELIGPCSSGRRLQTDDGQRSASSGQVQFSSLFVEVAEQLSLLSTNPFKIDWAATVAPLTFLLGLVFVIILGYWYFRRWDLLDQGFLVYAKPEVDRRHFHQRHEKLLDHYRENKGHMDWHSSKPSKKKLSALRAAMRPSALLGRRNMQSRPPPRPMARTASLHVHQQYDVLFEGIGGVDKTEMGQGGRTEKDIYVSNVVGDYLDSVMPPESLEKHSTLTWVELGWVLAKYHEYTCMFFGRSLNHPRLMRYTHVVLGLLLLIFFDSLFFGVFYPDSGVCEVLLSAEACLAEDSRISSDKLCLWSVDSSYAGGGQCTLNQPPEDFIFICLVVLLTVTFCVPLTFCYDLLLFNVCFRRPHLEEYLGRTTQKVKLSPIQLLYADTEQTREGDTDSRARQVYQQLMPPSFEADDLLARVTAYLATCAAAPDIPWQTSRRSVVQHAKTAAIQKTVGINPDGMPVRLTLLEWLMYGTPRKKLICSIERSRQRSLTIARALFMFGEDEVQQRDSTLIQYFILEQFSTLKQFVLKKHLFDYAASSPLPVSPFYWVLAWIWVVLTHAFCLYWALLWTVSQGGVTVEAWAINLAFGLLQDLFIVHAFRVYLIYILSMVSIKPQLKYIYRVLNKVAILYAQDEQDAPGSVSAPVVVQHISPACRAARLQITANLATGNILRYLDDVDVEMCSIEYSMRMSLLAVAMLAIPLTISFLSESLGDLLLETIFPPFFTSLIMCNYIVYTSVGLFVVAPYLLVIVADLWKNKVHKRSKKLMQRAQPHPLSHSHSVHRWNSANRKASRKAPWRLHLHLSGYVSAAYYLTRPMKLYAHLQRIGPKLETTCQAVWRMVNMPRSLQGHTGQGPTPTPTPTPLPTPMARAQLPEETDAPLPEEVRAMLAT
ncbi:hypothetical protein B484DRAFT_401781, partial [Ochromonadaceae sp. CCMP2298]